jgi:hypothetical protein
MILRQEENDAAFKQKSRLRQQKTARDSGRLIGPAGRACLDQPFWMDSTACPINSSMVRRI